MTASPSIGRDVSSSPSTKLGAGPERSRRASRVRRAAAVAVAAWLLAPWVLAGESCSKDVVCVDAVEREDRVELRVRSLVTYDITVTLAANGTNLASTPRLPVTRTIPKDFDAVVAALVPARAGQPWDWTYEYHWTRGRREGRHDRHAVYELPFTAGERRFVVQGSGGAFSHRGDEEHAVDWDLPEGTMVRAARGGVVDGVEERYHRGGPDEALRDEGNYVFVRHEDGTEAEYYHFQRDGVLVEPGQAVKVGDPLGFSGRTGYTTGPHLHVMVFTALDGTRRRSYPLRWRTVEEGVTAVRRGRGYTRPR